MEHDELFLQTPRLNIRHFRAEDAPQARYLAERQVMRYLEPPFDEQRIRDFIETRGLCQPPQVYALCLAYGRLVGHAIFHPYPGQPGAWELGWVLSEGLWGRGIAAEASRALMSYGFAALRAERFVAQTVAENTASLAVLRKLGFKRGADEGGLCRFSLERAGWRDPLNQMVLVEHDKKRFLPLLLEADEQESMIDRYLKKGTMYALYSGDLKAVCVLRAAGDGTVEIKNLAVMPPYRGQGWGRHMLDFVARRYRSSAHTLLVGTGESPATLPFYEACGFTYSHRVPDFFVENYDHPIVEGGVQLKDMVYLKREL